eukprot:1273076-Pleurochrysis_carterae.AAC.1
MRVSRLVQLRKASTVGVIWVAESVHEHAHEYFHGPAHVKYREVGFHVLQKVNADQLTQLCHGGQLRSVGLREECWPKINAPILHLQGSHPQMIVQR